MSIFLTETDRVIVQGMTGSEGRKHTRRMLAAGTRVVAGVNPHKAGIRVLQTHYGGLYGYERYRFSFAASKAVFIRR